MNGGSDSADRRAEAKQVRRGALLDAAEAVVRRDGPFVSMDQIAAECGITKPILYRHFGDRDGLVEAMSERFVEELVESVAPSLRQAGEPIDLLTASLDAYLAFMEREHELFRFLAGNVGSDKPEAMAALFAEEIAVTIERLLETRGLPTDPARTWAYGLVGMAHLAGEWWAASRAASPRTAPSRAEVVQQLASLLWQGAERLGLGDLPAEPPDPRTRPRTRKHRTAP